MFNQREIVRFSNGATCGVYRGAHAHSRPYGFSKQLMAIPLFEGAAHAASYAAFRPSYPPSVLGAISSFISSQSGSGLFSAVDVGCGSGQSTFFLASLFSKVLGVDVSEAQIKNARSKSRERDERDKVEFRVASSDSLPLGDSSVDLVTCAQAWHWLEPSSFYREAARVLRPRGTLAVYGYGNAAVCNSRECDRLVSEFYWSLRREGYWHENRSHIDDRYKAVQLEAPFSVCQRQDIEMKIPMSLPHFIGYVSTWSGYCSLLERHPDSSALGDLQLNLLTALQTQGGNKDDPSLDISFPVFVVMGQKSVDYWFDHFRRVRPEIAAGVLHGSLMR